LNINKGGFCPKIPHPIPVITFCKIREKHVAKYNETNAKELVYIIPKIKKDEKAIEYFRRSKGRFILATNDLDEKRLPDENILIEYKAQSGVEKGFKFLKDPSFLLDKLFLKTPNAIAALTVVMAVIKMLRIILLLFYLR